MDQLIDVDPRLIEWLERLFPDSLSKVNSETTQFTLGQFSGERKVVDKIKQLYKLNQSGGVHVSR